MTVLCGFPLADMVVDLTVDQIVDLFVVDVSTVDNNLGDVVVDMIVLVVVATLDDPTLGFIVEIFEVVLEV